MVVVYINDVDLLDDVVRNLKMCHQHDYDLDEWVNLTLGALTYSELYPDTLERVLMMSPASREETDLHDWHIQNEARTMLYHRLYSALNEVGAYNNDHRTLMYPFFKVHRGQVVLSDQPLTFSGG